VLFLVTSFIIRRAVLSQSWVAIRKNNITLLKNSNFELFNATHTTNHYINDQTK
jgi:hypothetical protein